MDHIGADTDVIVPIANGEPTTLLGAIDAAGDSLSGVRVHQMHALHERAMMDGRYGDRLRHVSYFLSHVARPHYAAGTIDLVPNHFSEVYDIMTRRCPDPLVVASVSPPDRHGNFSLGVSADYTASFIGRARFVVEVNEAMPHTFGRNQIHISQIEGWVGADVPLVEVEPVEPQELDRRIGAYVAERIPNGATIQTGIGAIPNAVMESLSGHRDLGVHTELLSDGVIDLIEAGVVTGVAKTHNRMKVIATFALGTQRVYDFCHDNGGIEFWPVRYVNDPSEIALEPNFVSVNASLAVDLLGQCASETIAGQYWSSSGGQADFARGAAASAGGQGFVVLPSTAHGGSISRIVSRLAPGEVVTTPKNTVDHVVTEYGVAELRAKTVAERARALIAIAHPAFRDSLEAEARTCGLIH